MKRQVRACGWFLLILPVMALAQDPPAAKPQTNGAKDKPAAETGTAEKLSDAERITHLQSAVDQNESVLAELQRKLNDPESEFARAEVDFKKLDELLKTAKREIEAWKQSGDNEKAAEAEKAVTALQQRWQLAKDRFDLAISERRTLQEQRATIETKIQQDRAALNRFLAPVQPKPVDPVVPPTENPNATTAPPAGSTDGTAAKETTNGSGPVTPTVTPTGIPLTPPTSSADPAATAPAKPKPPDRKLVEAREAAASKETEAEQAAAEFRSIEERIATLQKTLESERQLLGTARKKVDNARETERTLTDQADKLVDDGAARAVIQETRAKVREARQRSLEYQAESRRHVDRLDQLQDDLAKLQAERISALEEVETKQLAAETARKQVERFENPFSAHNLFKWGVTHGPRVIAIIVVMVILLTMVRLIDDRLVGFIAGRSDRGTVLERENRARTLVSVFHSAARVVVIVGGLLMVIAEFSLNITPLMGGVAVVGLAVAFGAQNLIRDFFSGFMILLENQYGVNDVVRIGENSGLVERVTLRLTVLRDLEGVVHFIPNGEVTNVRNMTHGWSRAVWSIGVAYKERVDDVMKVLMELADELRHDPQYGPRIMGDAEMLGVDSLGDSAVVIKFMIKTQPLQQWSIKRELLRRIKNRFDELGIEIPFPQRTVYHRVEEDESARFEVLASRVER